MRLVIGIWRNILQRSCLRKVKGVNFTLTRWISRGIEQLGKWGVWSPLAGSQGFAADLVRGRPVPPRASPSAGAFMHDAATGSGRLGPGKRSLTALPSPGVVPACDSPWAEQLGEDELMRMHQSLLAGGRGQLDRPPHGGRRRGWWRLSWPRRGHCALRAQGHRRWAHPARTVSPLCMPTKWGRRTSEFRTRRTSP